jgi:hypothetical protein
MKTVFFTRTTQYGPNQTVDLEAEEDRDIIAVDLEDIAEILGT